MTNLLHPLTYLLILYLHLTCLSIDLSYLIFDICDYLPLLLVRHLNLPLNDPLHLPEHPVPLVFDLAVAFRYRLAHYDEAREPLLVSEVTRGHPRLTLPDHVQLHLEGLRGALLHAALVGLAHDRNDEVHEDHVAKDHHHQVDQPGQDLEVAVFREIVRIIVPDGLSHSYHEKAYWADSFVVAQIV